MKAYGPLDRRSFLRRIGFLSVCAGALVPVRRAHAMQRSDNDYGRYADLPNQPGRTYGHTGVTDSDGGTYRDSAGHGRGPDDRSGLTDSDSGRVADPASNGRGERGHSGFSDSDSGRCSDPAGYGRGGERASCPDHIRNQ